MGIQSASATFSRFFVPDEVAGGDFWGYVYEKLVAGAFKGLDEGLEEAKGFAGFDDFFEDDFSTVPWHRGEYVSFGFRVDQRRVPAVVLKQHLREAVKKFYEESARWPSRKEKLGIQEEVETMLLSRAFAQPSSCEIVWNPATKLMLVGSTSSKMLEAFLGHFEDHFRMYPAPLYHAAWAMHSGYIDDRLRDRLESMVPLKSVTAVEEGRFLGYEFLTWLWWFVETGSGSIRVSDSLEAQVHLGERMVLTLPGEGREKVVCTTQANALDEARTALRRGKLVAEMQLFLMAGDNEYYLTLDSSLSAVKGLKTPKQPLDYDPEDPDGRFLERMFFVEEVSSVLDVLYGDFLRARLDTSWDTDFLLRIRQWMEQGEGEAEDASDGDSEAPF